jgi:hypothetical protein
LKRGVRREIRERGERRGEYGEEGWRWMRYEGRTGEREEKGGG